jgi:hypothetical protein
MIVPARAVIARESRDRAIGEALPDGVEVAPVFPQRGRADHLGTFVSTLYGRGIDPLGKV